jgi:hypothetical protein
MLHGISVFYSETDRLTVTGISAGVPPGKCTNSNSSWIMIAWISVSSYLLNTNHLMYVPIHQSLIIKRKIQTINR